MKCIYCNSEENLTSSDIISYAITGAKLRKGFVCKTHNAFTNDAYEKQFVAGLDFFRSGLGFLTRDGKPIQFTGDLTVDGMELYDVRLSDKESIYNPKQVIGAKNSDGNKALLGPADKLDKIKGITTTPVDVSDVTMHKTISTDSFFGNEAVHSVAKIAYEWYCYTNGIEEYKEEYADIAGYILGENNDEKVKVVADGYYYCAIDRLSEVGNNSLLQYDDGDGYRYVVFDLWKTIAYRVQICKSSDAVSLKNPVGVIPLYLYHFDGIKSSTTFGIFSMNGSITINAIGVPKVDKELWEFFVDRLEKVLSMRVMSVYTLNSECMALKNRLKNYDAGKMDLAKLIRYEDSGVLSALQIIRKLNEKRDQYDYSIGFNQNLKNILCLEDDVYTVTDAEKKQFIQELMDLDSDKRLSAVLHEEINTFDEIYNSVVKKK